jgi:hypothetical protein
MGHERKKLENWSKIRVSLCLAHEVSCSILHDDPS